MTQAWHQTRGSTPPCDWTTRESESASGVRRGNPAGAGSVTPALYPPTGRRLRKWRNLELPWSRATRTTPNG